MTRKKTNQEVYTVDELEFAVARTAEAGGNYGEMVDVIVDHLGPDWLQDGDREITVSWPDHCWRKSVAECSGLRWV
tara:strand:- start:35828 stop:36055 length:228 start_codon:yes stop_codon:yes gene_type:complete